MEELSVISTNILYDLFRYYCDKNNKAYENYRNIKAWGNEITVSEAMREYEYWSVKANRVATELNNRGCLNIYEEEK